MNKREFNYNSKEAEDLDQSFFESDGFQLVAVIITAVCLISRFLEQYKG